MWVHRVVSGGVGIFPFIPDLLFLGIPVTYLLARKLPIRKELGLYGKGWRRDLRNTGALFLSLLLISVLLGFLFSFLQVNDLHRVSEAVQEMQAIYPGVMLYGLVLVRSISEEVFFRGFLLSRLGVLGSTLLFGLAHGLYGSFAEVSGALLLGLILAIAYHQFGNLLPNMAAHSLYNFFALAVLA